MVMLAFDTCFNACSVAVADFGLDGIMMRATERVEMATGHAEALPPMIRRTLAAWGKTGPDVTFIAVTHGPGTFAGTRIGVAVARGLALALGKPAIGFSSLHAIAVPVISALDADDRMRVTVVTAIDARRGELYVQAIDGRYEPLDQPQLLSPPATVVMLPPGPVLVVGSGAALLVEAAIVAGRDDVTSANGDPLPDARSVALLASRRPNRGGPSEGPPRPLYLRAADVTMPRTPAASAAAGAS